MQDDDEHLKGLLRTLGMRPSRSAEAARERQLEAIRAMSVEERMLLALRLGRRDREAGAQRDRETTSEPEPRR